MEVLELMADMIWVMAFRVLTQTDIENISVLKGPAASALYGSRASHGVILITTKKADGKVKIQCRI